MAGCKSAEETESKFTLIDCLTRFLAFIYKKTITSQAKNKSCINFTSMNELPNEKPSYGGRQE